MARAGPVVWSQVTGAQRQDPSRHLGRRPAQLARLDTLFVARGYGRVPPREATWRGAVIPHRHPEHFAMSRSSASRSLVPLYISPTARRGSRAPRRTHRSCVVSDDGLQHYRSRATWSSRVDGARRFGMGLMLPSGPRREPVKRLRSSSRGVNGVIPTRPAARLSYQVLGASVPRSLPTRSWRRRNSL